MHPPLDRPHPDCQDVIEAIKACHTDGFKKYWGGCNTIKVALDECFRLEKTRLLTEMNQGMAERKQREQAILEKVFGKEESFADYLAKDKDYQNAIQAKLKRQQRQQAKTTSNS